MRSVAEMQKRVIYLRQQAEEYRKLAETARDAALAAQAKRLSESLTTIALRIEKNIPIHQRSE